ncbi:GNAT family N-acetyltransferase [Formosa sp. S-31]|uniref:GNAT family N-acetyltransferase n=1 Tax=Formosa sp. S-31 TaxID=2790949 RepID=UPI003EBABABD
MQVVRNAVTENTLSNPDFVTDEDCLEFIALRGKGWVCEQNNRIVGFAIADLKAHNIWALFVHPDFDKQGIGRTLHDQMLHWYFSQTRETVWLSTAPDTRAEQFYRIAGWTEIGRHSKNELKFEMTYDIWKLKNPHDA